MTAIHVYRYFVPAGVERLNVLSLPQALARVSLRHIMRTMGVLKLQDLGRGKSVELYTTLLRHDDRSSPSFCPPSAMLLIDCARNEHLTD